MTNACDGWMDAEDQSCNGWMDAIDRWKEERDGRMDGCMLRTDG